MKTWRLKKGEDRRFRSGHPWVYSNEIQGSPKDIQPGEPIELALAGGEFLAFGAGNPNSLIAFRCFSRREKDREILFTPEFFKNSFQRCLRLRLALGLNANSFRVCFGEADDIPGCVVDAYWVNQSLWVLVIQVHAAAIETNLLSVVSGLEMAWKASVSSDPKILIRRDLAVRKLEGLEVQGSQWAHSHPSEAEKAELEKSIQNAEISVAGNYSLHANLWDGQKTGFFLDQAKTISHFMDLVDSRMRTFSDKEFRFLDLFSYVGQWSAAFCQNLHQLSEKNRFDTEIHMVDSSEDALQFAKLNLEKLKTNNPARQSERTKIKVSTEVVDILKKPNLLPSGQFDVVVSDPPALIKTKKAMEPGRHEYVQLHTEVLKKVKPGGLVICCSCSFHLSKEDFERTLQQAEKRSGRRVYWLEGAGAAWDHPRLMAFPEGEYLKARMGWVE